MLVPIQLDRSKAREFAMVALRRFALSLAGAIGAKLGERLVDTLFANDDDEAEDPDEPEQP